MTIESLLSCPVDDIAKLTDEQLVAYLAPYFPQTRPKKLLVLDNTDESNFSPSVQAALARVRGAGQTFNVKDLLAKK